MRANGNGAPIVCANNLLRMVRGECPMDRTKGLDPALIGTPVPSAMNELTEDAEWLIGTYEPRVTFRGINTSQGDDPGDIIITAKVTKKEVGTDG